MTCCIRGYHVYKEICEAAVGEELVCAREPHNSHGRYTVAEGTFSTCHCIMLY